MARVDEIGAQAHPTKWRFMGRVGEITSHLVAVFWQQSGVASGLIRETGMASFIIWGASFSRPVRLSYFIHELIGLFWYRTGFGNK